MNKVKISTLLTRAFVRRTFSEHASDWFILRKSTTRFFKNKLISLMGFLLAVNSYALSELDDPRNYKNLNSTKKYVPLIIEKFVKDEQKKGSYKRIYNKIEIFDNSRLEGEPRFILNEKGLFEGDKEICHYAGVTSPYLEKVGDRVYPYRTDSHGIFCSEKMPFVNSPHKDAQELRIFVEVENEPRDYVEIKIRGKSYYFKPQYN